MRILIGVNWMNRDEKSNTLGALSSFITAPLWISLKASRGREVNSATEVLITLSGVLGGGTSKENLGR
jgi:hypothetical protein